MASLVFKAGSYYGIFSRGKKKKWLKIGRVDKKQAAKMLRQLELEYNKDRLNLNLPINITLDQYLEKYFKYTEVGELKFDRDVNTELSTKILHLELLS
jgi:hypothetical protein